MDELVVASVRYPVVCPDCDAEMACCGVQALVDGRLRWDVESACSACGFAVAACGAGEPPAERRAQLLAEHGPSLLRVSGAGAAVRVAVLRVVRAELGLDLAGARAAAGRVLDGTYTGTRPEIERLARCLLAYGVTAEAVPAGGAPRG